MSSGVGPFAIVLTTAGSADEAARIARELVTRRLAACVNVLSGVTSIYRWQGEVRDDAELLLVVKTSAAMFDEVRAAILELHSYELPEVLLVPIADGSPPYLEWLSASLGSP